VVISSIISAATTNSFATVNNTGAAANYLNMTEDDSVTVTGTAPNGYTVDLVIKDPNGNFVSQNGIAVSGGNWSATGLNLSSLDNGILNVTATLSGTSYTTTNTAVTHDKTAPVIVITAQDPIKKTAVVITGRTDLANSNTLKVVIYEGTSSTPSNTWSNIAIASDGSFTTASSSFGFTGNPSSMKVQVFPTLSSAGDEAGNITQLKTETRNLSAN
ncbi:MAG: hypothetical protein ACK47R_03850, partial [Planctomycetia bacterium]